MGWNDRLPEDPYIPYENETDRDNYEAWHEYMLYMAEQTESALKQETAGLSSQNVDPAFVQQDTQTQPPDDRHESKQNNTNTVSQ
jgi:hypothetical protein